MPTDRGKYSLMTRNGLHGECQCGGAGNMCNVAAATPSIPTAAQDIARHTLEDQFSCEVIDDEDVALRLADSLDLAQEALRTGNNGCNVQGDNDIGQIVIERELLSIHLKQRFDVGYRVLGHPLPRLSQHFGRDVNPDDFLI